MSCVEPVPQINRVMKGTSRLPFCTRPVPLMTRFVYGTGSVCDITTGSFGQNAKGTGPSLDTVCFEGTGRVQNGRRPVLFMTHSLLRTGSDRSRLVRTGPFKYLVKGTGFDFLQVRLHLGREPVLLMTCTKTPTGSFVV